MNQKYFKRIVISLLCLIPICFLSGCGVLRYFDGSSDEEVKKFYMSREEMQKEVTNLQSGNNALRENLDRQQAELDKLDKKDKANLKTISDNQIRIERLEREREVLREESKKMRMAAVKAEEAPLAERKISQKTPAAVTVTEKEPQVEGRIREQAQAAIVKVEEEPLVERKIPEKARIAAAKELRIKVLAGTGKLSAAQKLSKKLKRLGYRVERVDQAPSTNFKSDTIFFTKDSEKKAKELAYRLGKTTIVKPMTWSSRFDIIIVAKKKIY